MNTVEKTSVSPHSSNALVGRSFVIVMWEYDEPMRSADFFLGFDKEGDLLNTEYLTKARIMNWEEANDFLIELRTEFPDYGHYVMAL